MDQWTDVLRGLTMGRNTPYPGIGGIAGVIGTPQPTTHDEVRGFRPGSTATFDRYPRRIIRRPIVLHDVSASAIEDTLAVLKTAWRPSDVDVPYDVRLEAGERRYYGRPRGLDDSNRGKLISGVASLFGTFHCMDPYAYSTSTHDSGTVAVGSSPLSITNNGNATSTRATLTIVGDGGIPVITNASDPEAGNITFRTALAGGETATVDLDQTAVTVAGVNIDSRLTNGTPFFGFLPGANSLPFSGCASLAVTLRDAYE